jgi:hypothetical protein
MAHHLEFRPRERSGDFDVVRHEIVLGRTIQGPTVSGILFVSTRDGRLIAAPDIESLRDKIASAYPAFDEPNAATKDRGP